MKGRRQGSIRGRRARAGGPDGAYEAGKYRSTELSGGGQ